MAKSGGTTRTKTKETKTTDGESHTTHIEPVRKAEGKVDAFRELSENVARGALATPPMLLTGEARRHHVRATLREDHAARIEDREPDARMKFDILAGDLFKFFRGTALLFYRDLAGHDAGMPTVMALGDVHPTNFGVMPDRNGAPIFGVNDFDEAIYAPFTWDIKRGVTGFWIAAKCEGGLSRKKRRKIVKHFVQGYLDSIERYAERPTERNESIRYHNAPKVIRRLFDEAWDERSGWLDEDYLNENRTGFRPTDELQPVSTEIPTFQDAMDQLATSDGFEHSPRAGELKVKDVCIRHGQGTASLGLPRYYVLIEGPTKDGSDDLIIEFKRARRSALAGLTPPTTFNAGDKADRIAHAQKVQLAHGDIFYGAVEIWGDSYMSRERAPFREDIDLDDLSKKTWKRYARICGAALAQSHALSDDLGQLDYDIEPSIAAAASPRELFVADMQRFAEEAADRLIADHALFREDHAMDAFNSIEMFYR